MAEGLETTWRILRKTRNEAAVDLLVSCLDSAHIPIRDGAVRVLMDRRSDAGMREIAQRFERTNESWRSLLAEHPGRLSGPLREALLSPKDEHFFHACDAAKVLGDYDLMSTLVQVVDAPPSDARRAAAAEACLVLARRLYEELAGPRNYAIRRDPQLTRRYVLTNLERSLGQYRNHRRREVVEGFLILTGRDNVTFQTILRDPSHAAHALFLELLANSAHGGIIRLILSCLDDVHPPRAVLTIVGKRKDPKFVEHLLHHFAGEHSDSLKRNLKRVGGFSWLPDETSLIIALAEPLQALVVPLALAAELPKADVLQLIETLSHDGHPSARAAAITGLAELTGERANRLVIQALDDPHEDVQVAAARQLATRGVSGSLGRLLSLLDSPHESVRGVAREYLSEFNAKHFLETFDHLPEATRPASGQIVLKVDPSLLTLLRQGLHAQAWDARVRALDVISQVQIADRLIADIVPLLKDDEPLVRQRAAEALSRSNIHNSPGPPSSGGKGSIHDTWEDSTPPSPAPIVAVQSVGRTMRGGRS